MLLNSHLWVYVQKNEFAQASRQREEGVKARHRRQGDCLLSFGFNTLTLRGKMAPHFFAMPELSQTSLPSLFPHCRQQDNDDDEDDVVMVPGTSNANEEDESGTGHLKACVGYF